MSSVLYALGRWAARARGRVVTIWAAALFLLGALALTFSHGLTDAISIPGLEASDALESLGRTFPQAAGTSAQYVITLPTGDSIQDAPYRAAIDRAAEALAEVGQVEQVISPYDDLVKGTVSEDGRAALLTAQVSTDGGVVADATWTALDQVGTNLRADLPEGADAQLGGGLFSYTLPGITVVEVFGVAAAFIVLILNFGSLLAAGMPIVVALASVGATTALIFLATATMSVNTTTPILSFMLGCAVGIDYSLFVIFRHRQQLRDGAEAHESIGRAVATSGSAVVFAGLTVIVALLGLSVAGIPFLTVMGAASAVGVAMSVVAALTLLPALMSFAGDHLRPKDKPSKAALEPGPAVKESRFFRTWATLATRRPLATVAVVVLGLGFAATPIVGLRLALPDAGWRPPGDHARLAYDRISEHFGEGANATLAITATIVTSLDPVALMDEVGEEVRRVPGVAAVPLATPNPTGDTGVVQITPTTGPADPATKDLVRRLRDLRPHLMAEHGIDIKVTGLTAVMIDVSSQLSGAMLPFGVIVVGLSIVLLTLVFRSFWVPLKAALGYLLSVGAAFGAVVLVFERGVLAELVNVARVGPVIAFMPIVVMGVLFGLAMDYELFLVSRIREEYVRGTEAREAVRAGFLGSARVVAAAALIMFLVFVAFVPASDQTIKPMALGLAVGVFCDAFLVRMTLVPAVLTLLGDRAWHIPRWLDERLPHLDVEGEGLAREIALRDWPEPDTTAALAAEEVPVPTSARGQSVPWTTRVEPGEVHVVASPDPAATTAALLLATGRLRAAAGRFKVLGFVLPGRSGAVRSRAGYVDLGAADRPGEALARALAERPRLLGVDGLDRIGGAEDYADVHAVLASRSPDVTLLLATGAADRLDPLVVADSRSHIPTSPAAGPTDPRVGADSWSHIPSSPAAGPTDPRAGADPWSHVPSSPAASPTDPTRPEDAFGAFPRASRTTSKEST